MLDLIYTMVVEGSLSQTTSGLHLFDMFTESRMRRKGAKTTLDFTTNEDDKENDVTLVKGFGGMQPLHWGLTDQVQENVEIINLDGADNYQILITDDLGHKEQVSVSLVGGQGECELQINSDLEPGHRRILAKQLNNLNNFMQRNKENAPSNSPSKPLAIALKPHERSDDLEY